MHSQRRFWIKAAIVFLSVLTLVSCVSPSGSLINDRGQIVECRAAGFGIISGTMAKNRYEECVSTAQMNGYVMSNRAGLTGIAFLDSGDPTISTIVPNSSASREGLFVGDVVLAVDGRAVSNVGQARQLLFGSPETKVEVKVRRDGEELEFLLTRSSMTQ